MAIGIVRIESNSSLTFGYGLIILLLQRIELAQARMGRRQVIVQSEGLSHQLKSPLRGLGVSTPVIDPLPLIGPPQLRVCLRTLRVQGHGLLPQLPCLGNSLFREIKSDQPAQVVVISFQVVRAFARDPPLLLQRELQ